ncbi:hypothetical protein AC578_9619 [Lecanosticta acicola]|uniref:ASST-domain-containing protein n=1 Tax=Lecanosticta acicola TaxID=111012 RepID=A0AAI8Z6J9_9PEZI|nr:hypothetical protein AC578_9619 [Lecanosticta acicola]
MPTNALFFSLLRCLLIFTFSRVVFAQFYLDNETSPTHQFKSRPDLHAPILDFAILRPDLVTPGYIFLAPYRNLDPGPYIYDNLGNLVWSGAGHSGPKTAHTPRVCRYKGTDHLCYFTGEQHLGFARGHGVILDQNYRTVKTIEAAGAGASNDMHEFKITPYSNGTTVLMTVYQPRQYDVTTNPRFNLHNGIGWIVEGVFQEVDIDTGRLIFEWRSLDHVDPSQAWTLPGSTDTSGDGLHEESPWDYFHLNSVDKNQDGDYLISARHVSAIYKVSGKDGHIMWELGGNKPTFKQTNFAFSYQHHARWISENQTHTVLSFFDNASSSFNATGRFSHGWIVAIDHVVKEATVIKEWGAPMPEGGLLSTSQGNVQMLPNGGCHIGWGEHAYFSEHTADGTTIQFAKLAERTSNVMIYRSNKYNWTAQPVTKPALWSFSKQEQKTGFWVSWNGATEVKSWNFYVSNQTSGPFELAGSVKKTGFETEFHMPTFAGWSFAEALDGDGRALDRSVVSKTFVPSEKLRSTCDDSGCKYAERVPPEAEVPYEAPNEVPAALFSTNRGFNTSHYYEDVPGAPYPWNHIGEWEEQSEDGGSDSTETEEGKRSSSIAVPLGLLIGFTAAIIGFFFFRAGGFRKLQSTAVEVTESAFGSKVLQRYTRVHTKESDYRSHSSSSSRSGIL